MMEEEIIKAILEVGLEEFWETIGKLKVNVKRKLLDYWLRADFEKFILPEEIELGLLKKERKYPILFFSLDDIPTRLNKTHFPIYFDFTDPLFRNVTRCGYWTVVLMDNFLPEMKIILPLEASYALCLSEAEIRAFRRGEHEILQLFRS